MHLRTAPALLARTLLTAIYGTCLWSIRACTMTSSHIQAMAVWLHDPIIELKIMQPHSASSIKREPSP